MFLRKIPTATTPVAQTQPLNTKQIANDAGGYVFEVPDWDALSRFLTIGTQGGSFYVGQQDLTERAESLVVACLKQDALRVVQMLRDVSMLGRAIKQDYGIFALALTLAHDDLEGRKAAYMAIPDICRTASTLFQLLSYLKGRRGWSRGLRNAIASWYATRPIDKVAYQVVKYRERSGFTHRDVFRLAHPLAKNGVHLDGGTADERNALYSYVALKPYDAERLPQIVRDYEAASTSEAVNLELASVLPRESLPTPWLNEPAVWEAMLEAGMPMTALIRNLGNLSKHGVLVAGSEAANMIVARLTDVERIRKSRIHPIAFFLAASVYGSGKSVKGSGTWAPVRSVMDALEEAFMLAFPNVVPTGKKILVAIDVSGSMRSAQVAGIPLTAAEVALAMALVTIQTEPNAQSVGFDVASGPRSGLYPVEIGADERLRDVRMRFNFGGGGTDCGLPFEYAKGRGFEAIVIYTDNETWAGRQHAVQTLAELRRDQKANLKVVCAATTATRSTVADPGDRHSLQVSGFDASVPSVISEWLRA